MEPFFAHHTGMLCEVCEAASYLFRLENVRMEKRHVKLRSFTEARRNLDCPLCAFGVGCVEAEKKLPSEPDNTFFWVQWQLLPAPLFRILFSCPSPKGDEALPDTGIYCHFNIIGAFNPLMRGSAIRRHQIRSTIDISQVKRWVYQCKNTHDHTQNSRTFSALGALIRNGGFKLVNVVTLEINTIHSDDLPSYVALSYVWSQKQHQNTDLFESRTDLQNQEKLRVRLDALPRTLRESILFARDLELTFIWIDELCIDQAHSPMKSYIIESMGAIYAAADLVIVAAAGDATAGLPGTRFNPRAETESLVRATTATGDSVEFVVTQDSLDQKLKRSIWYDRGWTFQEYAFAQRSVVVFPDEAFFVCGDDYLFREAYEYTSAELDDRPFSTQLSVKYNHGL